MSETPSLQKCGIQVLALVKAGTSASVWKARTAENRTVALKAIRKQQLVKATRETFLQREVSILTTLDHPNIVRIFQIIETTRHVYLSMEYLKTSVAEIVSTSKRLTESIAAKWFLQLCAALSYLHARDIAHRDLKCENMMVDENNDIRVIDFGLARFVERDERSATFCGTASYAAPEVLGGLAYDPRKADLWSAGVVLYIMVVGAEPFNVTLTHSGVSIADQMRNLQFGAADVSKPLQNLIGGLLRFEENRYNLHDVWVHQWTAAAAARLAIQTPCSSHYPTPSCTATDVAVLDEPTLESGKNNELELSLNTGNVLIPLRSPAALARHEACRTVRVTVFHLCSCADHSRSKMVLLESKCANTQEKLY